MKAEEEIAAVCVKAIFVVLAFLAIAAWWLFVQIVRLGTRLLISIAIDRGWIAADPEVDQGAARLAGLIVGSVVGVVLCMTIVANGGPAPGAAVAIGAGAILGAIVAPVEADPWRARPTGWVVDDWSGDDRREW